MDPNTSINSGFSQSVTSSPKKNGSKMLIVIIVLAVVAAAVFFLMSKNQKKNQSNEIQVTPSATIVEPTGEPTKEATPSATKKPTSTVIPTAAVINKAQDLNIQVLNGSGKEGAASSIVDLLKKKGYTHLEAGNADNFNYVNLTIRIKNSRKKFLSDLQNDLSTYTISSQSGSLSDSALFDASLIVGK